MYKQTKLVSLSTEDWRISNLIYRVHNDLNLVLVVPTVRYLCKRSSNQKPVNALPGQVIPFTLTASEQPPPIPSTPSLQAVMLTSTC